MVQMLVTKRSACASDADPDQIVCRIIYNPASVYL